MTVLPFPMPPVRVGDRVYIYALHGFRPVERIWPVGWDNWCAVIGGIIYSHDQVCLGAVELHPPRDTLPCEMQP